MEPKKSPEIPPLIIDGPPWEKKHELGFFLGFLETIKAFLFRPAQTFSVMRRSAGIGDALTYTVALQVFTFIWSFSLAGADPEMLLPKDPEIISLLNLPDNFFRNLVFLFPVSVILIQFISAYAFHVAMKWRQLQVYDFKLIFRIFAYASGTASVLLLIPIVGGLVSMALTIYIAYNGLKIIYGMDVASITISSLLALLLSIGLYLVSGLIIAGLLILFALIPAAV